MLTSFSPASTSCSLIAYVHPPTVAGVALDVTGCWLMQLFHHVKFGGFLHLPQEHGEGDTSKTPITPRAPFATTTCSDRMGQKIQDSGWSRVIDC